MDELKSKIDVNAIKKLANNMRKAIQSLPKEELGLMMESFPKGACGDSSLLLGTYFVDCGFLGFRYVCGERGRRLDNSWTSHAWLLFEDLIVDITADQFADMPEPVIVSKHSKWHQQFTTEITEISDFRLWTGTGTCHLHQIYAKLKPILERL